MGGYIPWEEVALPKLSAWRCGNDDFLYMSKGLFVLNLLLFRRLELVEVLVNDNSFWMLSLDALDDLVDVEGRRDVHFTKVGIVRDEAG